LKRQQKIKEEGNEEKECLTAGGEHYLKKVKLISKSNSIMVHKHFPSLFLNSTISLSFLLRHHLLRISLKIL
jgi:hypothetical protein